MAKIINEDIVLLDSAIGPVVVKTTDKENFDVDDYVQMTVKAKAENLRIVTKAKEIDPLEAKNRPPVQIDGVNLGGYDAV